MDHEGNPFGNCEGNLSSYGGRVGEILYITGFRSYLFIRQLFFKGDGTVDVVCDLTANIFGSILTQNISNDSGFRYEPVTFSFLGEEVSAYIAITPYGVGDDIVLESFHFPYDVTVQEEWTY